MEAEHLFELLRLQALTRQHPILSRAAPIYIVVTADTHLASFIPVLTMLAE